ncbi:MAG TPA: hypothetical protein QGF58_12895 [Myxococcota bacterium]|nr:hypothetical protein [Myxococcota bacterium]
MVGALLLCGSGPTEDQKVAAAEKQARRVLEHAAHIHGLIDATEEEGRPLRLGEIRSTQIELHQAVIRLEAALTNLEDSGPELE